MVVMELYDVMRSTPAVREFTDDPLPDDVLGRILDNARFAPSGGNRQGVRVVVLRDEGDAVGAGGPRTSRRPPIRGSAR